MGTKQTLSLFLLKDSVKSSFEALTEEIQTERNGQHVIIRYFPTEDAEDESVDEEILKEFEATLCYKQNKGNKIKWINFLSPIGQEYENLKKLFSSSASLILIFKSLKYGKFFAIAFGHSGRHFLNSNAYVENFGLKVTLNAIDHEKIIAIDERDFELNPVDRSSQSITATAIRGFSLNIEQTIIRGIKGKTRMIEKDESEKDIKDILGETVGGKDSLIMTASKGLKDFLTSIDDIYDIYKSKHYEENFGFIDNMTEVKNRQEIDSLNKNLESLIENDSINKIFLAPPELIPFGEVLHFSYCEKLDSTDEPTEMHLASALEELKKISTPITVQDLKRNKVYCISSDEQKKPEWDIYNCMYAEVDTGTGADKKTFLLSNKKWYEIEKGFISGVDKYIKAIKTSTISDLYDYKHDDEGDYNKDVAEQSNGEIACMDRRMIHLNNGQGKIEFCDLYHNKNKKLIHVKRYYGVSSMSHLFEQGRVSAEFFFSNDGDGTDFRKKVNDKLAKLSPNFKVDNSPAPPQHEIIYAIVNNKKIQTVTDIPIFSKISLRNCHKFLKRLGVGVSIKIIDDKS